MRLTRTTVIEVPADELWTIVAHRFDRVGDWATAVDASAPAPAHETAAASAPVPGRVCQTGLDMAPQITETIRAYDESRRTLTYEGAGLPAFVVSARNTWHVVELGERRSRVTMDAVLETRGIVGLLLLLPLRLQLVREGSRILADLKHYAEQGRPSPRKQRRLASVAGVRSSRGEAAA